MAKKSDVIKAVTKPGIAKWPHLVTPRTTFDKDGVYETGLVFDSEEWDSMDLKETIIQVINEHYEKTIDGLKPAAAKKIETALPWSDEVDEDDLETGNFVLKFKSKASYENKKGETITMRPKIFDGAGNSIKRRINIGSGTVMCVATAIKPYYMTSTKKVGVTLYLNAVQIRKLVEYGDNAEAMGFETDGEAIADDQNESMASYSAGDEEAPEAGDGDF